MKVYLPGCNYFHYTVPGTVHVSREMRATACMVSRGGGAMTMESLPGGARRSIFMNNLGFWLGDELLQALT